MKKLSLEQILFYLNILDNGNMSLAKLSYDNILINIYGSVIKNLPRDIVIEELKSELKIRLQDTSRNEFTFGFTSEKFPNLNPKYYGKNITYWLSRLDDEISIYKTHLNL